MRNIALISLIAILLISCAPECVKEANSIYRHKYWDDNVSLQEEIYERYGGMYPNKDMSVPSLGVYFYNFIDKPMTIILVPDDTGRRYIDDFQRGCLKK